MYGKRAVGIDVGQNNTVVAWINPGGHSEVLRDREGGLSTPTAVFFDEENLYIGEEAKLRGNLRADLLAVGFKSDLGKAAQHTQIRGRKLPPEVVLACFFHRLRFHIFRQIGGDFAVVLTVPSRFGELERSAVMDAAQMAGLEVLDIIVEPVAAALAFCEHGTYVSPGMPPAEKPFVLVYDLGGYGFEATLIEVQPGGFQLISTVYDETLGGDHWDERIVDYVAEHFLRVYQKDIREDKKAANTILARAARVKKLLGLRENVVLLAEFNGHSAEIPISRTKFAELTSAQLEKTIRLSDGLLKANNLHWTDLHQVLLVGGATHMRSLRQRVEDLFRRAADHSINPEETVARGAALYAQQLMSALQLPGHAPRIKIINVASHSLGIEGLDLATREKVNKILIPRGTPLPVSVSKKFVTKASAQKEITVVVLEGESSDPGKCKVIGKAVLRDLPQEIAEEWPIDVTYEYSATGHLKIDAKLRYTDCERRWELVRPTGLTRIDRLHWQAAINAGRGWNTLLTVLSVEPAKETKKLSTDSATVETAAAGESGDDATTQRSFRNLAKRYAQQLFSKLGFSGDQKPHDPLITKANGAAESTSPTLPDKNISSKAATE